MSEAANKFGLKLTRAALMTGAAQSLLLGAGIDPDRIGVKMYRRQPNPIQDDERDAQGLPRDPDIIFHPITLPPRTYRF